MTYPPPTTMHALLRRIEVCSSPAKLILLVSIDLCLLSFSLWLAASLRLESLWPEPLWGSFWWLFAALPAASLPVFIRLGLYRAMIRYTGMEALGTVAKAAFFSVTLFWALLFIFNSAVFPFSIPFLYGIIATLLLGGCRLVYRALYSHFRHQTGSTKRVVIYGAGNSGTQICTAFKLSTEFQAVAFVDDNPSLQKRQIHGVRIYAPDELPQLVDLLAPDLLLLAMPSASRQRISVILAALERLPVPVKTLPYLEMLVGNEVDISQIREVAIEDLLGRDPVPPRPELLRACIKDKSVMVTGAGGSIGSELCRQIAGQGPRRLVLFERSEFALYSIEQELRSQWPDGVEIVPILGSVCHQRRVEAVLRAFGVQTIYHAAAYKHVPLVEYNPIEGIRNNLFGTLKTALAAMDCGVETFVLISTDKAVRPTNVMGASKRMAEQVLQALFARQPVTKFTMVRFGNVLGSSGSVVPLFRRQILERGPVTVTHPEITRYFMTIPEAVALVLQAGAMGRGGDVFVLDMGKSVKIVDLARRMIHLSGLVVRDEQNPDGDIEIVFSGLRPGEKLYEELLVGGNVVGTDHPMIMRAEETFMPWDRLSCVIDALDKACHAFDLAPVRELLQQAVDGYEPQCEWVDPVWLAGNGGGTKEPLRVLPIRRSAP